MAVADNLIAVYDINMQGNADNAFRERINDVLTTATGSPALENDRIFTGMDFDGSTQWVEITTMPAGVANVCDGDHTLSVCFKADNAAPTDYQVIFGLHSSSSNKRAGITLELGNSQVLSAQDNAAAGSDVYLDGGPGSEVGGDGTWHVATHRRSGNVISLWLDGVKIDEQTVTLGTFGVVDRITIGRQGGAANRWPFDGKVKWAMIWDAAKSDADVQVLHTQLNPSIPDGDGDYAFDTAGATLHYAPAGAEAGDQIIMRITDGDGNLIPTKADINPTVLPTTIDVWAWDVSALTLLERLDQTLILGTNAVQDTFTDANGTLITAHTPDVDELSAGWELAKEYPTASTPVDGVEIQSNQLQINDKERGAQIDGITNDADFGFDLVVADQLERLYVHLLKEDDENFVRLGIRTDTGDLVLDQRHNGVVQGVITNGTGSFTFGVGTYAIRVVTMDESIDVYVNDTLVISGAVPIRPISTSASKVGVFSATRTDSYPINIDNFFLNSEFASVSRSLSFDKASYAPGESIVVTITGDPLDSAVNSATVNGVSESISSASTTGVTIQAPPETDFRGGGDHEGTRFYENIDVEVGDGTDFVSGTIQIVPSVPANFGSAGPVESLVYPPTGLIELDDVYIRVLSGAGTANPETASFDASELSSIEVLGFSIASGLWLPVRTVNGLNPFANKIHVMKDEDVQNITIEVMVGSKQQVQAIYVMANGSKHRVY